jgi:hypothetical protein
VDEEHGTGVLHSTFRSERFLDIDNVPGTFYPDLVEDINQCYRIGVNDATLVLVWKLLENLFIDILRDQYGKQEIDLYYLLENRRLGKFSDLIIPSRKISTTSSIALEALTATSLTN